MGEGTATVTVTVTATDAGGSNGTATQTFTATVGPAGARRFTDDPIVPGETPVKAVHFTELRARIDTLRSAAGLPRFSWTDPVLRAGVTRVRLTHLLELRSALAAAYAAAERPAPRWIDAVPCGGVDADTGGAPDGASRRGAGAGVKKPLGFPARPRFHLLRHIGEPAVGLPRGGS